MILACIAFSLGYNTMNNKSKLQLANKTLDLIVLEEQLDNFIETACIRLGINISMVEHEDLYCDLVELFQDFRKQLPSKFPIQD